MKKPNLLLIAALFAMLILAACGGGAAPVPSGGAQPAPGNGNVSRPTEAPRQQAPAQSPPNRPSPTEGMGGVPLDLNDVTAGLDALDSYKATFNMSFDGTDNGQPKTGSFQSVEEFVKNPPAKRTTITGLNASASESTVTPDSNTFQMIQVNGKDFVRIGTTCLQQTASEAPQAASMFTPASVIGGVRGAQLAGEETINGVPTRRYKTDVSGIEALGYLSAQGDVWVAQPGDFVVKYTLQATGKDQFFGNTNSEGTVKWTYEISDVNQPIDIRPPADCASAAQDIPIMSDAENQSVVGPVTTYNSPSKSDEVVAFYEKEMAANGWTEKEGGFSAAGVSQKVYGKDKRTVQIMITTDQSSGSTSVLITEEK